MFSVFSIFSIFNFQFFVLGGQLESLVPNSMHFRGFPIPQDLKFKSFSNLWDNSYIPFLVIIVYFHFTCGKAKLCLQVKKSPNIFWLVARKIFLLLPISFKCTKTPEMSPFGREGKIFFYKNCRGAIWTAVSTIFIL